MQNKNDKNMVLVISAMKYEIESLITRLLKDSWMVDPNIKKGVLLNKHNKHILFYYTGVGKKNVKYSLKQLPESVLARVSRVIAVGFAGALKQGLQIGDVLPKSKIFTSSKMLAKSEKLNVSNEYDVVDMEDYYIKEFFAGNVNVENIKVVSDDLDFEFPDDLDAKTFQILFTNKNKFIKFLFFLKNCFLDTKNFIKLLRMYHNFRFARKRLTDFLYDELEDKYLRKL